MYKIYKLIKNEQPIYVGLTTKKYLSQTKSRHKAFGKTFDDIILIEETRNPSREAYWIEYYDTFNNGENKTIDGKSGKKFYSDMMKAVEVTKKPIRVFNDDGFEMIFESCREACRQLKLDYTCLSKVALGKEGRKQHKGFKAEYLEGGDYYRNSK